MFLPGSPPVFLLCLRGPAAAGLRAAIGALVRFLALAVKVTVESLLRLAALILATCCSGGVWLAGPGLVARRRVFLYFLICEVLRGEGADEQEAAMGR